MVGHYGILIGNCSMISYHQGYWSWARLSMRNHSSCATVAVFTTLPLLLIMPLPPPTNTK